MNPQTPTDQPAVPASPGKSKKPMLWMLLTLLLAVALGVSIFMWKPWQANIKASDRTVTVTGTATISAVPDEFVFSPSYDFTNADKSTAISQLSAKSDDLIAKLKGLGVASDKIKSDANNYNDYYSQDDNGDSTYTLDLTITVDDQSLSQKVQDYLLTTDPTGSITPSASFSTAKETTLQSQARDKAEQNARSLADQSAKNLGFKVDKVKTVTDNGFDNGGGCGPGGLCAGSNVDFSGSSATPSLSVQPGENDLSYSVGVTYYIH